MILKHFIYNGLRIAPGNAARRLSPVLPSVVAMLAITSVVFGESAVTEPPPAPPGREALALQGSVCGERGEPLVGALVSIFGAQLGNSGLIAFTDEKGRFLVAGLEPGYYTIRAYLSGFLPSRYSRVELDTDGASSAPVSVQMVSFRERETASLQSVGDGQGAQESPAPVQPVQADQADPADEANPADQDDRVAEFEWLLRHSERNILHEQAASLPESAEASETANVLADQSVAFLPTGELGLFAFERGLHDLPTSPGELDAQLAYARVNIPTGPTSEWIVSAQLLESALSSWAAQAEFVTERSPGQQLTAGVTYGNHVYGNVDESTPQFDNSFTSPPSRRTNEWFGSAYGAQRFQVGAADFSAGLTYHHYSYLDDADYAAPRLEVAFSLDDASDTVVRGLFDYRVLAPGGEDLGLLARMVSADFMGGAEWGQRGLTAETTVRYQVSVERFLGDHSAVELRVFQESVRDPLLKAYVESALGDSGPGHYLVMNQGDLRARGVGLAVTRDFGEVAGSVGYRFGVARALAEDVGAFEGGQDQNLHDLTTSVRTEIDRTRTSLLVVYRFSIHPSLAPDLVSPGQVGPLGQLTDAAVLSSAGDPARADLDSRFNVQVHQLLPFIGWNSTQWELVLAVRNLFYEDLEAASLIDEMSVVDSPARVMGGVKVQF